MTIYRNSLQKLFFLTIFNPFLPISIASIGDLALIDGFAPPFLTTGSDEFSAGPAPHKSTDVALKTSNETVPGELSKTKSSANARNSSTSSIPTVENPPNVVVALRNGTNETVSQPFENSTLTTTKPNKLLNGTTSSSEDDEDEEPYEKYPVKTTTYNDF